MPLRGLMELGEGQPKARGLKSLSRSFMQRVAAENERRYAGGPVYAGHQFTRPVRLADFRAPYTQGVYAILENVSAGLAERFRMLYFGEAINLRDRITRSHEHFGDWLYEAGGSARLFVAVFQTSGMTEEQRCTIERKLIRAYNPPCNAQHKRSFEERLRSLAPRREADPLSGIAG